MRTISEAMNEFKSNERYFVEANAEFHISVEKPVGGSYQKLIDEFDTFLVKKGLKARSLDMDAGKLVFGKPDEIRKAKKVLDKSIYKDKYTAS